MPRDKTPRIGLTRRSLLTGASAAGFGLPWSPETDANVDLCRLWLAADGELDRLYTEWASLDVSLTSPGDRRTGPDHAKRTDRMAKLDSEIDVAVGRRDDLLQRLQEAPVRSTEGALGKLRVAVSRLEGEGGSEHRLVRDALLYLARKRPPSP